jgi:hypothetical protein
MRRGIRRLAFGALLAVTLLAVVASAAAALRSLDLNESSINVTYRSLSFIGSGLTIACPATFDIVFNEDRIAKTERHIGSVTGVRFAEASCSEGARMAAFVHPLTEFTSIVEYAGFTGVLPEIASFKITILVFKFLISAMNGTIACLYEGQAGGIFKVNRGAVEPLEADSTREVVLKTTLVGPCPLTIRRQGLAAVLRGNNTGGVTVGLV